MNNFPKGNDLIVKWAIKYSDGTPFPLENYAWELCYSAGRGINVVKDTAVISVSDNLLTWRFSGKDQAFYGKYSLTLRLYQQGKIVATVRKNNAFELSTTQYDGPCDIDLVSYCDNISLQDALLRGNRAMEVAQGAKDIAGSAVNTAAGAVTTANEAKNIASTANNTSTEAKTIANNAKTVADQAKATADATAATATQKAEEVAQKEAQLEAALNNLSTDQSGALALSTKVNDHGEKLTELESDTKYVLDNITIGAVVSMARKLYTNDITATYATDFTRVGYYDKTGAFVSDSNYRTSARFQLPKGGYLFEFYTETQIIGCIRISDADDNTVRMLTQDGLNYPAGDTRRFPFLYSSLDENLYLEISRFVGASEYPKIYTAMDGPLTTKEYVDGQLSESLNGLMMQRILLTHDKIVNSEFYDGYYWSSYNERTALESYTCGKVDLTSLRGRYIILNPGFFSDNGIYIPGYSYIQKQDGTILALSKIPATQFERVPIIKTFNNDKCILLYVDSSYSTLIWSIDKNRMPEFAVISGVTPSVAAELATQSNSISDLSSSISNLSLLINSVDNRTYSIESGEQIDFPESNNGKYIESNGNIHEAISTTGAYRLSDSILVNVGDKFIIHAGSYNSAILALYSSTNQLLDIIFRSTSQQEYYDNVYEVKNPNAHHIVFGYQKQKWGASKFNYATTTPLNEVVAQLKTQIESSESTLSGKTIFLFGDSISSSDYTWYVEYLQKYTGARVLNQGASGRNAAYQASNEYFTRLANNPADVVVALVGGNDSGASGTIGTFSSNTALAQMGESVVTETDIADDYNGTKYIQAVSHIIRKWRATYWNFRLAAGLTANILDTQNDNAVVYPTTGTATEQQCIDYAATQGWTLGYGKRYVMMTTETDAAKRTKLMAVKQPKLYFCTTLPQKRYDDASAWSNPENWERKRLAIIECCQKYGINCIDLAKDFAIDWSKEPYWPGQGYTGTSKTDNQGIYTMDGLHPNEFGYEWIARIVSKVIK